MFLNKKIIIDLVLTIKQMKKLAINGGKIKIKINARKKNIWKR